ncbi:MAG: site-2 protease family protein [Faecalibacterium sp.]
MVTMLAAIFIFGLVIAFHEFGHFVCAKWSGIQVNEFSIGMGPLIFKKKWHGTQYSVRALPVGGYVAMEGEESPESKQQVNDVEETNLVLQEDIAQIECVSNPLGNKDATTLKGKSFNDVALWKRFVTIAAGAAMNFVLGFLVLFVLVNMEDSITSRIVYGFNEDALCQETGLMAEDEIVAVNGRYCFIANDIVYELSRTEDNSADFIVIRNGEKIELENVQFDNGVNEDGSTYMQLNFIVYGLEKTPVRVLEETIRSELYYGRIIFSSLIDLATGRESINNLSGPVGIVSAIGTAASYGLADVLSLLALITINLGIFNLLPLPMLDGGKLVFLLIEGVTGKAVPDRVQNAINMAGLAFFLGLMLFTTYNDIIRLMTGSWY